MQNLRDKLMKAGKVSKRQKRAADQGARQRRTRVKGHKQAEAAQAKQEAVYAEQLEKQRVADQALEAVRRAEREEKERHLRAKHLIEYYGRFPLRGRRRWFFMARNGTVQWLDVREDTTYLLERGDLAVVEPVTIKEEDEPEYQVIPRDAANKLWDIDPEYVRFLNRNVAERPYRHWECDLIA